MWACATCLAKAMSDEGGEQNFKASVDSVDKDGVDDADDDDNAGWD